MARLTAKQACEYLGIKLDTLYKKVQRREVAYWKNPLNNRIEFEREDLDALNQWVRVEVRDESK